MRFLVLGPLEARTGGEPQPLGGPRQRAVLAALLLRANQVVSVEYLADAAWDRPPARPEGNLRTYVSGLRRHLGAEADRLVTRPGGYLLRVEEAELDLLEFDRLAARAQGAEDPRSVADLLGRALRLWRGRPFEGLAAGPALAAEAAGLEERYHGLVCDYVAARFLLGEHTDVVPELRRLTAAHPLREQLWSDLVTALHRSGRRADALAAYQEVRALLDRELGVAPGARLVRAHADVLADVGEEEVRIRSVAVAQLPAAAPGFAGRAEVLRSLDGLLPDVSTSAVVAVITGTAGIGKTAVAVQWAHRVRSRFGDGQLYLNLRGHGGGEPLTPGLALAALLATLGVDKSRVPADPAEAAALYRSLLADRRILVLLDNAVTAEQVRLLLPGTPCCLTLVTSRNRLDGLVARDGARLFVLDLLNPAEARGVLEYFLGRQRTAAEPEATGRLADLCARLPLALRIAGANVAGRPGSSIEDYVTELRTGDRLTELEARGDPDTAVRAAIDLSCRSLEPETGRLFRLLGLIPGPDVTVAAAAALSGADQVATEHALRSLASAHLVEEHAPGRFTFHDLLRLAASEQCEASERTAAQHRLLLFYAMAARAAMEAIVPRAYRPLLTVECELPTFADSAAATRWLDAEISNLVPSTHLAGALGQSVVGSLLVHVTGQVLDRHGDAVKAFDFAETALSWTRATDNFSGQVHALWSLSATLCLVGEYDRAEAHMEEARRIVEREGVSDLGSMVFNHLGRMCAAAGRPRAAVDHYRNAVECARKVGHSLVVPINLLCEGDMLWELGELVDAHRLLTEAKRLAEEAGDRAAVLTGVFQLGRTCQALGRYDEAVEHFEAGQELCHELNEPAVLSSILNNLAGTRRDMGDHPAAVRVASEGLLVGTELNTPKSQSSSHHVLGSTYRLMGRHSEALAELRLALTFALKAANRRSEGDALVSLAELHLDLGRPELAREFAGQALDLSRATGNRLIEAESLRVLGEEALGRHRSAEAARLLAEAHDLHRLSGYRLGLERTRRARARLPLPSPR
ncbi:BTAD domain-containing putative transcriptional regulator [Lentzea sp. CA-135723]|uniref:AfsR/SARP family transcriptional regulator n=1 Tax=Lentzea sp. CA-135723 TaxID=3239950 RepID=UPI003D903EBA